MRAVESLYGASVLPTLNAPQPPARPRKLLREASAPFTEPSELDDETLPPGVAETSICVSNWNTARRPAPMSRPPRTPTYERLLEMSGCQPRRPTAGVVPNGAFTSPDLIPLVAVSIDTSR